MIKRTLKAICEVFDCQVVWDAPGPEAHWDPVCSLGSPGDRSVGIDSFFLTDTFKSEEELKAFAESEAGWKVISQTAAGIFPEWDPEKEGWAHETFPAFHECLWVGDGDEE